jgi:Mannose-6-phosphate isomerase
VVAANHLIPDTEQFAAACRAALPAAVAGSIVTFGVKPTYPASSYGEDMRLHHETESAYVPIGAVHRLTNPGKIPLELIEVQVGSYLGEADILRLEDVYSRA